MLMSAYTDHAPAACFAARLIVADGAGANGAVVFLDAPSAADAAASA